MIEENKVAENVSAGEAASVPSAKRNKRKLAGIIGVVAAVVVVAGAGFMARPAQLLQRYLPHAHGRLSDHVRSHAGRVGHGQVGQRGGRCIEHAGPVHAQEGITCVQCHVPQMSEQVTEGIGWLTGSYEVVQTTDERFVPEEKALSDLTAARGIASEAFCLNSGCHTNDDGSAMTRDDLIEKTSYMKRNPHVEEHGEVDCNECHKAHRASTVYCSKCHSDATIPDGWVSYKEAEALEPAAVSE